MCRQGREDDNEVQVGIRRALSSDERPRSERNRGVGIAFTKHQVGGIEHIDRHSASV
jgi:hypothetical protein